MKYLMAEYQKLINQLRMVRADLEEKTITREVQKLAANSNDSVHGWLSVCIASGMRGEKMPWEDFNKQQKNHPEQKLPGADNPDQ